jgi:FMN-dependent NADH-azoreductase
MKQLDNKINKIFSSIEFLAPWLIRFGSDIDFASDYIRHILGFIGIKDVTFITADKHLMDKQSVTSANAAVDELMHNYA